ncbi:MAG: heavy metal translocating P-type ATPase [Spirochaetales bacterium]|nr:heavy metal translocating P-type ATPase [Spirochaetales bacterium]
MKAALVHSLPGRARFRFEPGACAAWNAAAFGRELGAFHGVRSVSVNPRTGGVLFFYDSGETSAEILGTEIARLTPLKKEREDRVSAREASAGGGTGWAYIGYQLFRFFLPPGLKPFVTVFSALGFFSQGFKSLARFKLDVAVLDAAAVAASLLQGNYDSASTLIMLLKTGEYLEAWARRRSRENLSAALSLGESPVWLRREGFPDSEIPSSLVKPQDRIVLRGGALVPIDGKVVEGRAYVNESALTGEPLSREKVCGSALHAGTVVEEGEVVAEALKKADDTRYEKILRLIEESEKTKSGTEIRAGELAGKAVPITFAAAALTLLFSRNPRKAASVLSVDYSCAIKLATPLAFLAAIREGLACGVFFKGGAPLEKLAGVDTVVFDKTGTLTLASPSFEKIIPYNGFSENEALKIAACLEEHFPHPAAKAVVAAALERGIGHKEEHSSLKYIAAHGIASEYGGKHTVIGSRHFIGEDEGVSLSLAAEDERLAASEGLSVLYLAQEKKLAAILLIKDPVREEAAEVIAMLRALGVRRLYLLSGDNKKAAEKITRELGLDGGLGELLPADKYAIIKNLKKQGCRVAFVGDGMNDSPAMSAACVGIAMKDGADLARETADIVLKEASLYPLAAGRLMAMRVMKRVGFNTRAAIILNSLFILLGLTENTANVNSGGSRSVWLHNLTTLALSLNAMRAYLGKRG